jgi:hypothetical protein
VTTTWVSRRHCNWPGSPLPTVVPHVRQGDHVTDDLAPAEVTYLRAAIDLARRSRTHGNHPFGALLVDAAGVVAAEADVNGQFVVALAHFP